MSNRNIDITRAYTLEQIVNSKFIEGVKNYQCIYRMVSKPSDSGRILRNLTNKEGIKAFSKTRPGTKISGKIFVNGKEIVRFLSLHNLW